MAEGAEPGPGSVTLRAVAAHAGVSKSLVSRVLQGSPHVSDRSRAAVEDAIRTLGYRPNGMARSLTERRTRLIGVLCNDLRQPWFVDMLEGLNEVLHAEGLHVLVGEARLDRAADTSMVEVFMGMRVDGLVLAGSMLGSGPILEATRRIPTVVAGSRDLTLDHVDVVAQDDDLGAEVAVRHLISLGHRHIGHVAGYGAEVYRLRRAAYERVMTEHGLASGIRVAECDSTESGGYLAAQTLLESPGVRPTAIFAANDFSCLGVISAASEAGLAVPDDLALVGFDNSYLARMRHISLTSVDIDGVQVGELAARFLVERMATPDSPAREHLLTPRLEVRRSCGALS